MGTAACRRRHRQEPRRLVQLGLRRPWVQISRGRPALIHALCARQVQSFSKHGPKNRFVATDSRLPLAQRPSSQPRANGCSCAPFRTLPNTSPTGSVGWIPVTPDCSASGVYALKAVINTAPMPLVDRRAAVYPRFWQVGRTRLVALLRLRERCRRLSLRTTFAPPRWHGETARTFLPARRHRGYVAAR